MFRHSIEKLLFSSLIAAILVGIGSSARAAQPAVVSIDGAMVYKGASFDSPVIAYLKKGKRVKVSSKSYGPFYRVLIRRGLVGYISDIDVKVKGGGKKKKRRGKKRKKRRSRDDSLDDEESFEDEEEMDEEYAEDDYGEDSDDEEWSRTKDWERRRKRKKPVFARRFIGGNAGVLNFKEEILEQSVSGNVKTIGAKLTGPNLLFEGPYIFDVNLYFGLETPSYYAELSQTDPSGFLVIVDAQMIFPYHVPAHEKWTLYFGAGPILVFSKFEITVNDQLLDLQDLKLGASFMAGFSYEISKDWIAKLEPKFFVEKNSYIGVFGVVQKEF